MEIQDDDVFGVNSEADVAKALERIESEKGGDNYSVPRILSEREIKESESNKNIGDKNALETEIFGQEKRLEDLNIDFIGDKK